MQGIDYDVWAFSPILDIERRPEIPRSAINNEEAEQQALEFVEKLKKETGITDWVPKWRKTEFDL